MLFINSFTNDGCTELKLGSSYCTSEGLSRWTFGLSMSVLMLLHSGEKQWKSKEWLLQLHLFIGQQNKCYFGLGASREGLLSHLDNFLMAKLLMLCKDVSREFVKQFLAYLFLRVLTEVPVWDTTGTVDPLFGHGDEPASWFPDFSSLTSFVFVMPWHCFEDC